jgi:hypothetical protein
LDFVSIIPQLPSFPGRPRILAKILMALVFHVFGFCNSSWINCPLPNIRGKECVVAFSSSLFPMSQYGKKALQLRNVSKYHQSNHLH